MARKKELPPLVQAVLGGVSAELRQRLAEGCAPDATDQDGRTALHHAAIQSDSAAARVLLLAGANPCPADKMGWTPLHFAAQNWDVALSRSLLTAGALVDAQDLHGNTPLFRAVFVSRGRGELILLLRAAGADPARENNHGASPLSLANTIANFDMKRWFD